MLTLFTIASLPKNMLKLSDSLSNSCLMRSSGYPSWSVRKVWPADESDGLAGRGGLLDGFVVVFRSFSAKTGKFQFLFSATDQEVDMIFTEYPRREVDRSGLRAIWTGCRRSVRVACNCRSVHFNAAEHRIAGKCDFVSTFAWIASWIGDCNRD